MSDAISNGRRSKFVPGFTLLGLLAIALVLLVEAHELIDVIDEGLMHKMTIFESEPKEGWNYWRWRHIREGLLSWIVVGAIWLAIFGLVLRGAYRTFRYILS